MISRRKAFTLVELLVVIAIIGMLVAILLPAVQAARAAGRRTVCKNNLRQIGLGLQSYHEAQGQFPIGGLEVRFGAFQDKSKRQLAWSAFLLPYLEEQPLYDRLNLQTAFDSSENQEAAATILPIYLCPSSSGGVRLNSNRGPCHYGGIQGESIVSANNPPKGIMLYDIAITAAHVQDGLSQTLIVAEDTQFLDGQWINGRNIFDVSTGINQAAAFENDIRSDHPGGAHGVRADGSVHFMEDALDVRVLAALSTRDGNDWVVE